MNKKYVVRLGGAALFSCRFTETAAAVPPSQAARITSAAALSFIFSPEAVKPRISISGMKNGSLTKAAISTARFTISASVVGVGSATLAMANALLGSAFIRLTLCWVLSMSIQDGFQGIYWGQALSPIIPAIIGAAYFYSKRWKKKKLIQIEGQEA